MEKGTVCEDVLLLLLEPGMFFVEPNPDGLEQDDGGIRVLLVLSIEEYSLEEDVHTHCCIDIRTGLFWNLNSGTTVKFYTPSEEEKYAAIPYLA